MCTREPRNVPAVNGPTRGHVGRQVAEQLGARGPGGPYTAFR
jgi:hypothetical protein